jgi:hypothetical protein
MRSRASHDQRDGGGGDRREAMGAQVGEDRLDRADREQQDREAAAYWTRIATTATSGAEVAR